MSSPISRHFKSYFQTKVKYKGGSSGTPIPGKKIYKMSSNENPYGTSPQVLEHLQKHIEQLHLYPDTTDERLRKALVDHYKNRLTIDQFLTANSGSEIIQLIIKGFLQIGDEVIVSSPYFVPYSTFSEWAGATVKDVPLVKPSYKLDIAGIADAVTDKTRIIFITSPNNPSGTYVNKTQLEEILSIVPSDVLVIYDEVYQHFIREEDYATAEMFLEKYPNLIGLNSFSKAYGMASLRLGYMYSSEEISNYIRLIQRPFPINKLAMEAGITALGDQGFIDDVYTHVQRELEFLHSGLTELGIAHIPSSANFIMFQPPKKSASFVKNMTEEGIILRPLDNYMAPGWVRVSISSRDGNQAFLKALRKIVG